MKTNLQKENAAKVNQITEGVIWKQLLLFFFPILFGTLFQQVYNTADTVVVGRFVGKEALATVGSSSSTIGMIVSLLMGIGVGASVIISQYYGAGKLNKWRMPYIRPLLLELLLESCLPLLAL